MVLSSTMVGCRWQGLYRPVQEQSKWNNSWPCRLLEPGRNNSSLVVGKWELVLRRSSVWPCKLMALGLNTLADRRALLEPHRMEPYKPAPGLNNSFGSHHSDYQRP